MFIDIDSSLKYSQHIFIMATSSPQTKCSICNEDTDTLICRRCSKNFCFLHLIEHQQFLNEQFSLVENDLNQSKQTLLNLKNNSQNHPLLKQIDQWENESIV